MKILYKAGNITEAHIVKGLLESNDIPAHVGGFYLQGGVGELAAMDFAHVYVSDEDYETAIHIIKDYEGVKTKPSQVDTNRSAANKKATISSQIILSIMIATIVFILFYFISAW